MPMVRSAELLKVVDGYHRIGDKSDTEVASLARAILGVLPALNMLVADPRPASDAQHTLLYEMVQARVAKAREVLHALASVGERALSPLLRAAGAKYLARGGEFEILAGDMQPERLVLIETLKALAASGVDVPRPRVRFGHGVEVALGEREEMDGRLVLGLAALEPAEAGLGQHQVFASG